MSKARGKPINTVAFGYGDVRLGGFMGLVLGFPGVLLAIFLGVLLGGLGGFLYWFLRAIILRRYSLFTAIPYGPFLVAGAMAMLFFGPEITRWWMGVDRPSTHLDIFPPAGVLLPPISRWGKTMLKTHNCGDLRATHADPAQAVTLAGWVHRYRTHGGVIFVDLRDRSGLVQVTFRQDTAPDAFAVAEQVRNEWVIQVQGTVPAPPAGPGEPRHAHRRGRGGGQRCGRPQPVQDAPLLHQRRGR